MKFSDNLIRDNFDLVFVKRTTADMEAREEYHSRLWEFIRPGSGGHPQTRENTYSTPARDLKIGESIYNEKGEFVAYRVN